MAFYPLLTDQHLNAHGPATIVIQIKGYRTDSTFLLGFPHARLMAHGPEIQHGSYAAYNRAAYVHIIRVLSLSILPNHVPTTSLATTTRVIIGKLFIHASDSSDSRQSATRQRESTRLSLFVRGQSPAPIWLSISAFTVISHHDVTCKLAAYCPDHFGSTELNHLSRQPWVDVGADVTKVHRYLRAVLLDSFPTPRDIFVRHTGRPGSAI